MDEGERPATPKGVDHRFLIGVVRSVRRCSLGKQADATGKSVKQVVWRIEDTNTRNSCEISRLQPRVRSRGSPL